MPRVLAVGVPSFAFVCPLKGHSDWIEVRHMLSIIASMKLSAMGNSTIEFGFSHIRARHGHDQSVAAVPDTQWVVSGSRDCSVRLFDLNARCCMCVMSHVRVNTNQTIFKQTNA